MKNRKRLLGLMAFAFIMTIITGCGTKKVEPKAEKLEVVHFTRAQGLPEEDITTMAAFAGQIWVGTPKGLLCYDGVNWKIHVRKNTNVLGSDKIEKIKVSDRALWIATDNGACRYDGNNWGSVYTGGRARAVSGKGSDIAVATAHGVEYSSGGSFSPMGKSNAGLVYDEVTEVAFDSENRIWAGTRAGMAQLTSGVFQNFTGPAKSVMGSSLIDVPPSPSNCRLIGNNVKTIISYRDKLAIGTTSGLSITDMKNSWTNYFSIHKEWVQRAGKIVEDKVPGNSPLPGNIIYSLATTANDELLFIGTDKGLAILKDNTWIDIKKSFQRTVKGAITGLAILKDDLWIGTRSGIYLVKGITKLISSDKQS